MATSAHESPEHLPVQDTSWKTQTHDFFWSGAVVLQGLVFFYFLLANDLVQWSPQKVIQILRC